jgi:hypothetical protein
MSPISTKLHYVTMAHSSSITTILTSNGLDSLGPCEADECKHGENEEEKDDDHTLDEDDKDDDDMDGKDGEILHCSSFNC